MNIFIGVELLGDIVTPSSVFWGPDKMLFKAAALFLHSCQQWMRLPTSSHPCQRCYCLSVAILVSPPTGFVVATVIAVPRLSWTYSVVCSLHLCPVSWYSCVLQLNLHPHHVTCSLSWNHPSYEGGGGLQAASFLKVTSTTLQANTRPRVFPSHPNTLYKSCSMLSLYLSWDV